MMSNFFDELQNSDWLGRSPDDYTYKKSGISIGWEKTLVDGDAFSSFILPVRNNNLETERKAFLAKQACAKILSRMNSKGVKTKLVFTKEFNSYQTDGEICVTLEPLNGEIPFPTFNHSLDPIMGYCVHEVAHLLYTPKEYGDYIRKFKGSEQRLKGFIMNILEDERIENLVSKTFRGYNNYLGKAKDYCFGKRLEKRKAEKGVDEDNPVIAFTNSLIHLLRYPKALDEETTNKYEKEFRQVIDILTPYPTNIPELTTATEAIYKLIEQFKQEQEQEQGEGEPEQGEEQGEGESNKAKSEVDDEDSSQATEGSGGSSENTSDGEKGEAEREKDESDGSGDEEEDNEEGKDGSGSGDGEEDGEGEDGKDEDSQGEDESENAKVGDQSEEGTEDAATVDQVLEALIEAMGDSNPVDNMPETPQELADLLGDNNYSVPRALEKIASYNNSEMETMRSLAHTLPKTEEMDASDIGVFYLDVKKLDTTTNHYDRALAAVKPYASSLRAKIKQLNRNHTIVNRGLHEGDFDESMLVDALVGAKNVYKEDHKILNQGACIALLIDESGSMHTGGRWFEAMKIAVMFERALQGVNNTDFYCYGHTTASDGIDEDMTCIKTYYEGRKKSDRKILGKIHHHATNRDGHAILETVAKIRTQIPRDMPIVMFMISDGQPSARVPRGYSGVSYTKKAVDTVEKYSNAQIIHIAITEGIKSEDMFNQYVKFTNHSTLVKDVGRLLKKVMLKQQKAMVL